MNIISHKAGTIIAMLAALVLLPCIAEASGDGRDVELGIGTGYNLNGHNTRQAFLSASLKLKSYETEQSDVYLDSSLSVIDDGENTFILDMGASYRYYPKTKGQGEYFFEVGGGIGTKNRDVIDRRALDGDFLFSFHLETGMEFGTSSGDGLVVSVLLNHFSNGGIYDQNQSVNLLCLAVSMSF